MNDKLNILTCVYCGHEYPAGTPASGSEVQALTDHIKICEKHPMREAEEKNRILWNALAQLVGVYEKDELEKMLKVLDLMPDTDDKRFAIEGIRALLSTKFY